MGKGVNKRYKNGAKRRAIRNKWKALEQPCALCGKPIDYSLPACHPLSFEVDEIVSCWRGGDPLEFSNTQPVHRQCNKLKYSAEKRASEQAKHQTIKTELSHSREW